MGGGYSNQKNRDNSLKNYGAGGNGESMNIFKKKTPGGMGHSPDDEIPYSQNKH